MSFFQKITGIAYFFILFVMTRSLSFSDSNDIFYIIHVKGKIQIKSSGKMLETGKQVSSEEELVFKTPDAIAAVISPKKGRFTLKADNLKIRKKDSELVFFFKSCLFPSPKKISTRKGALNNLIDLHKHFSVNSYLILGTAKVNINHEAFPMSDNSFFYVRYIYQGQTINKKLGYEGNILIIDKGSIYVVDAKQIAPEKTTDTRLYYYEKRKNKKPLSTKIASFNPIFPDEEQLKSKIGLLISVLKDVGKNEKEIENEISVFLYEFYGKTDLENVRRWLETN